MLSGRSDRRCRCGRHHLGCVVQHTRVAASREGVGIGHLPLDRVLEQKAVGRRDGSDCRVLEGEEELTECPRVAGHPRQPVEGLWRPLVVGGLAGGEDEARDALADRAALPSEGDLGIGATRVVADQGRAVQVEPLDRGGDQAGHSFRGKVRVGVHRRAMGAEGQIENEAAELAVKDVDDLAPEIRVRQPAVTEDEGGALTALEVVEGAPIELE